MYHLPKPHLPPPQRYSCFDKFQVDRATGKTQVRSYGYLGRILSFNNSDWPTLYANLKKAQQKWGMLSRLLARDGASPRARGMFYKAVCQAVLLYGCETWTVTKSMLRVLEGFHHKCARRISGLMARQTATGWYYPPLATAMAGQASTPSKSTFDAVSPPSPSTLLLDPSTPGAMQAHGSQGRHPGCFGTGNKTTIMLWQISKPDTRTRLLGVEQVLRLWRLTMMTQGIWLLTIMMRTMQK
jgi:hypothetical protein